MAFICFGASDELCAPDIASNFAHSSRAMERTVGHWDSCGRQSPMTSAQRAIAWKASCGSSAVGGTSFPSQAESRVGAEPIGALNVMDDISVPPAGAQIPSELGRFRRQLKRDGPARRARTGAVLGIALTLRRACAGRMSGPLPSIHTRSPLHSGQGTRPVPEHAALCQTPHAGGGMSAFFEWRDVGKGRAWRRSLEEGRLDLIGTKSAKQFKTKRSLPRLSHDPCEVGVAAGCGEVASLHPCTCILYKYMYSHAP